MTDPSDLDSIRELKAEILALRRRLLDLNARQVRMTRSTLSALLVIGAFLAWIAALALFG